MKLRKFKKDSNMYDWCSHGWNPLGGPCPHECFYCSVVRGIASWSSYYKGSLRLVPESFKGNPGTGKTIFVCSNNDLFAEEIDQKWIEEIIGHCFRFPKNKYVFQTKNPMRAWKILEGVRLNFMIGTTIETNRDISAISKAPLAHYRKTGIAMFYGEKETFVTIEPIMDFDPDEFVQMIVDARPSFVNIGADSKRCNLHEPSADKIRMLIRGLQDNGVKILKKVNLARILGSI